MGNAVRRSVLVLTILLFGSSICHTAHGQQRPLLTEDPHIPPSGALDVETGIAYERRTVFRISGLEGTHLTPSTALNFSLGERSEFQMAWTVRDYLKTSAGDWRQDFGDLSLSTKINILRESSRRPLVTFRPTIVLPNANQASGLGLNTTRFFAAILAGKTFGRAFLFGNIGLGILDDPVRAGAQNDVLTDGLAAIVTITPRLRLATEFNGVQNARSNPSPGSETRGQIRMGIQIDAIGLRWDAAGLAGLTRSDPQGGLVVGVTKRFLLQKP